MPSSFMMGLHNSTSTYSDHVMNVTSPLQGFGSVVNNRGQNMQPQIEKVYSQIPNLTNQSEVVIRQQMDESNHKMVQMLDKQWVQSLTL